MADFVKKDQIRRGVNTVLGEEYADKNARLELKDIVEIAKTKLIASIKFDFPMNQ